MLHPRSPLQMLLQRYPQLIATVAHRAKWGALIGAAIGVSVTFLVWHLVIGPKCAADPAACGQMPPTGPTLLIFLAAGLQMGLMGAVLASFSAIARTLILGVRLVNDRDRELKGPDGQPLPRDQVFHSSWSAEAPKTEAEKHRDRFHGRGKS